MRVVAILAGILVSIAAAAEPAARPAVLVLPLKSVGPDTGAAYIGRSICQRLESDLARDFPVIRAGTSRIAQPASVEQLMDRSVNPPILQSPADDDAALKVARDLGARVLVWGTYTVNGDQLRVRAGATDVPSGKGLGAIEAQGSIRQLGKVEDALARQARQVLTLAEALAHRGPPDVAEGPEQAQEPTTEPGALEPGVAEPIELPPLPPPVYEGTPYEPPYYAPTWYDESPYVDDFYPYYGYGSAIVYGGYVGCYPGWYSRHHSLAEYRHERRVEFDMRRFGDSYDSRMEGRGPRFRGESGRNADPRHENGSTASRRPAAGSRTPAEWRRETAAGRTDSIGRIDRVPRADRTTAGRTTPGRTTAIDRNRTVRTPEQTAEVARRTQSTAKREAATVRRTETPTRRPEAAASGSGSTAPRAAATVNRSESATRRPDAAANRSDNTARRSESTVNRSESTVRRSEPTVNRSESTVRRSDPPAVRSVPEARRSDPSPSRSSEPSRVSSSPARSEPARSEASRPTRSESSSSRSDSSSSGRRR